MIVSIVTPTFNSVRFIQETYQSIQNQAFDEWEWVVTDDCSTDGTFELLEEWANTDKRIDLVRNPANVGAAETRNLCLRRARGQFIAFLDSDDIWHRDKLSKQIAFMGDSKCFSFTGFEWLSQNGARLNVTVDTTHSGEFSYQDMLAKKATLGCSTVMLRRSCFSKIQFPLIRSGQDYALWLELLKTGSSAHLLSERLSFYRIVSNSLSRNKVKKAFRQWSIYRDLEGLSLLQSTFYFSFYVYRAFNRRR